MYLPHGITIAPHTQMHDMWYACSCLHAKAVKNPNYPTKQSKQINTILNKQRPSTHVNKYNQGPKHASKLLKKKENRKQTNLSSSRWACICRRKFAYATRLRTSIQQTKIKLIIF